MKLTNDKHFKTHEEVHEGAFNYFQEFLSDQRVNTLPNLSNIITVEIMESENEAIVTPPTKENLEKVLKTIPKDSSSRPDGFGSKFYIVCSDFIKKDISEAAIGFFNGATILRFFSSSFIVLMPKVKDPIALRNLGL